MSKKHPKPEIPPITTLKPVDFRIVPIDSIKPNSYNPNRQSEHEFELLCRSIEEDGFTQPILVNETTGIIVDGEHRWRACKALGFLEVPVCFSAMDDVQVRIATLRHNRASGTEDIQRAADVMRELDKLGAVDWAKDSLILSEVESNMMLDMIPKAELKLRTEGMGYDQIQHTLDEEKALEEIKIKEDKLMAEKDGRKYTLQFTFLSDEAVLIKAVIGREHADGILALCKEAKSKGWA